MTSCGMYQRHRAVALIALAVGLLVGGAAIVAQAPVLDVPPAAEASPAFDAGRATEAYIALVPPEQRARSDAYFEGSTWLQLWNALYSIFTLGLLLAFGWSARMRDLARRITNRRPLQTLIYWVQFVLYVSVVSFPLTVYSGFYREHQYGLATQTFSSWAASEPSFCTRSFDVLAAPGGSGRRASWSSSSCLPR